MDNNELDFETIKETKIWKELCTNSSFEKIYAGIINKHMQDESKKVLIDQNRIIMNFSSPIRNRELSCQYRDYSQYEIYLDEKNNLIINKMVAEVRSNYGYDFSDNNGGLIDTSYSYNVYDSDGVELSYQNYNDSFSVDSITFDKYKEKYDFEKNTNPQLEKYVDNNSMLDIPNLLERNNPSYVRRIRQSNDLGLVRVTSYTCTKNDSVFDYLKEELFFNTFLNTEAKRNPLKLHIVNGFPFATKTLKRDIQLKICDDFLKTGLTSTNFRLVANDRFLKELREDRKKVINNPELLEKYDLMIEKVENKRTEKNKTL